MPILSLFARLMSTDVTLLLGKGFERSRWYYKGDFNSLLQHLLLAECHFLFNMLPFPDLLTDTLLTETRTFGIYLE